MVIWCEELWCIMRLEKYERVKSKVMESNDDVLG